MKKRIYSRPAVRTVAIDHSVMQDNSITPVEGKINMDTSNIEKTDNAIFD